MSRFRSPAPAPAGQRGAFALGLVVGLLIGLFIALGVALWVSKVPVPFVNKVPQRTAEQDAAEAERNRNWDPNAPLATRQEPRMPAPAASAPAGAASGPVAGAATPIPAPGAPPSTRDPAAILAGKPVPGADGAATTTPAPGATPGATAPLPSGADPYLYFVQAGAYTSTAEAEQQRARLAMMGLDARVTEREQSGRTVYRVRLGPYDKRDLADATKAQIDGAGIESVLVRVQRTP